MNIKQEAKRNSMLSVDIDNFKTKYRESEDDLDVVFPSFDIGVFDDNFFILLTKPKSVKFEARWVQRPGTVSKEFYNTEIFWPLILYINQVYSMEDFKGFDEILILPYESVLELVKSKKTSEEIIDISQETNISETKYYKSYPLDSKEIKTLKAKRLLSDPFPRTESSSEAVSDDNNVIDGGVI